MRLYGAVTILMLAFLAVGCASREAKRGVDRESSHLRWLVRLYVYANQQGRALKSEQEFKKYLSGIDPGMRDRALAGVKAGSMDELFVSERDGLPYEVLYGRTPQGVARGVIAFEQQGVGGKRYVGNSVGIVEEVDQQRFDELVPKSARD